MADSGLALFSGLITRLKATAGLTSIVGTRIYSIVPQQTEFPYVRVAISAQPFDTKSSVGMTHLIRVQGFSRKQAYDEALNIRAQIVSALERQESNITVSGFKLVKLDKRNLSDIITEDDGITRQSIVEFEAIVE
jgi:hypothetical protein